jgi:hypothetical protein
MQATVRAADHSLATVAVRPPRQRHCLSSALDRMVARVPRIMEVLVLRVQGDNDTYIPETFDFAQWVLTTRLVCPSCIMAIIPLS